MVDTFHSGGRYYKLRPDGYHTEISEAEWNELLKGDQTETRNMFAAAALTGLLAMGNNTEIDRDALKTVVAASFKLADIMLEESMK